MVLIKFEMAVLVPGGSDASIGGGFRSSYPEVQRNKHGATAHDVNSSILPVSGIALPT